MFFKTKRKDNKKDSQKLDQKKVSEKTISKSDEVIENKNIHIDVFNSIDGDSFFISGWYYYHAEISNMELVFDDSTKIDVDFIMGQRKDVSIHNKHNKNFHDWGFSLLIDNEVGKVPRKIIVDFLDGKTEAINLQSPSNKSIDYCFDNINGYNNEQKKKVIYRFIEKNIDVTEIESNTSYNNSNVNYFIEKSLKLQSGILVFGWFNDYNNPISKIKLVKNGKSLRSNLDIYRRYRKDVNIAFSIEDNDYDSGIILHLPFKKLKDEDEVSLLFLLESGDFIKIHLSIDFSVLDKISLTKYILSNVEFNDENSNNDYNNSIIPSLHDVWHRDFDKLIKKEYEFNKAKKANQITTSIIIPIYGRYDFINYQLAHFINNTGFEETEIIYAIDDPKIFEEVLKYCKYIAPVYDIYFRLLFFNANLGFGGINNIAAKYAVGKRFLFLNSDIIPKNLTWLQEMNDSFDKLEKPGVLGVDLLYYDESVQHKGMKLVWSDNFNLFLNEHPGKGLPKKFYNNIGVEKVPTVTAACIMIEAEVFNKVGGFDLRYILGDFEDSDLCLKLIDKGYTNYVNHDIELYHLERQSQNLVDEGDWKFKLTLLNGWQHTNKWQPLIKKLTKNEE